MSELADAMLSILACPNHPMAGVIREGHYLICTDCRTTYEIVSINGQEVPNLLFAKESESWQPGYRDNNSALIESLQGTPFAADLKDPKEKVLDVGCGENPRGYFNLDCYVPARLPTNFILGNVEKLPVRHKAVDVITSHYNLEHLVNPASFITAAAACARHRVEIITDNSDWVGDALFRVVGSGRIFHDEHYYKWSAEYLENLLRRLGFSKFEVQLKNYSNSGMVTLVSKLSVIRKLAPFFLRDIHATVYC